MITDGEIAEVSRLLGKLQPGFLPFDVFHQVTRLWVSSIVEFVPLRRTQDGRIEVLLLPRADDDPVFPGTLHTPGVVVLATDALGSYRDAFERLLRTELPGAKTSEPVYVMNSFHSSGRGTESANIYWVEMQSEPTMGAFYDIEHLPGNLIPYQLGFIAQAAQHYAAATNPQGAKITV